MTEFRGRGDEVRVYPLSFQELFSVYNGDKYDAWEEYSMYGGLPLIISKKNDSEKSKYLSDLLAKTFSSNGINECDMTISTYIDYLIDAFLINKAKRYDIKGKKCINSPCKYYFTDIGVRNARLNFRQYEQTHIMENIIYNELLIRGFNVDVGVIEHRIRDENGKQPLKHLEVDFVCNKGSQRYYIQSAFSIPNNDKMLQEQASLDKIKDSFKKIIITQDRAKPWRNEKGYVIINLLDFLLKPELLDF